jgi:glycine/D-amino acid oxidase-like deaminating enzyme
MQKHVLRECAHIALWLASRKNSLKDFRMPWAVAIVGAGVSGLTCAVVFAERGYRTAIFAKQIGSGTTSAAAAAIWYPYDAGPSNQTIAWALETYGTLLDLARDSRSGVSMIEQRIFRAPVK